MATKNKKKSRSNPKSCSCNDCKIESFNLFSNSLLPELLTEILLRVSCKSLIISKSVCKRWNFLISEESFMKKFIQRSKSLPPLINGFFFSDYVTNKINFYALSNEIDSSNRLGDKNLGFIGEGSLKVLDSHYGILLVCTNTTYYRKDCVVCNPFNKQFVKLPRIFYPMSYAFIVCCEREELDVEEIEYNVVSFWHARFNAMEMTMYSSETRDWKDCTVVHNVGEFKVSHHYVLLDGSIFLWDDCHRRLCVYDLKEQTISVVELPTRPNTHRTLMGVSGGSLYYAEIDPVCFSVWVLDVGVGWSLKHRSGYKELVAEFLEPLDSEYSFCPFAFHPRDPNLVFVRLQCATDFEQEVLLYHLDTETTEVINDFYPSSDKVVPYSLPASVPCLGNIDVTPSSYTDHQPSKSPSLGPKFSRKIVKAVTYRVKSVPSASKPVDNTTIESTQVNPPVEPGQQSSPKEAPPLLRSDSIVSLGKSPSYKEVALAPPGSIAKMQVRTYTQATGKSEEVVTEEKENISSSEAEPEKKGDKSEGSLQDSAVQTKDKIGIVQTEEDSQLKDDTTDIVAQDKEMVVSGSSDNQEVEYEKESTVTTDGDKNLDTTMHEEDAKEESFSENVRDVPNKKLSASAAPFNPSPTSARASHMQLNIGIPPGPIVGPWPVNMTFLPGAGPMCSSPLHPYPSPPRITNMMHPMLFMYPPYSPSHGLPPSSYAMTSGPFPSSHIAWHSTAMEFVPGTVWHSVESTVSPPATVPIANSIVESPTQPDNLPAEAKIGDEEKNEFDDGTENKENEEVITSKVEKVAGNKSSKEYTERYRGKHVLGHTKKLDDEGSFNILLRGKRTRKQTLRMPISLLNKPYGSQSFKLIYNRVIRGSEEPKPSLDFFTSPDTASSNVPSESLLEVSVC